MKQINVCMSMYACTCARERERLTDMVDEVKNSATVAGVWKLGLIKEKDGKQLLGLWNLKACNENIVHAWIRKAWEPLLCSFLEGTLARCEMIACSNLWQENICQFYVGPFTWLWFQFLMNDDSYWFCYGFFKY